MKTLLLDFRSRLADVLAAVPYGNSIMFTFKRGDAANDSNLDVDVHGIPDYASGHEILRLLGVQKWKKQVFDGGGSFPWCTLHANIDDTHITLFCGGLPPTCRLVEKIVEVDEMVPTGKKIQETRFVADCGKAETSEETM